MMYLLASTDGRTRACTATIVQALSHYDSMVRAGLAPILSDTKGRAVCPADLRRRLDPRAQQDARH